MENAKCLKLKKAEFYPNKIIIKSKWGNTIINSLEIDYISYTRPTVLNHIIGAPVRLFVIHLRPRLYGEKHYVLSFSNKVFEEIQTILKVNYVVN